MSVPQVYRALLRELRLSAVNSAKVDKTLSSHYRVLLEKSRNPNDRHILEDVRNAVKYLSAQREYKALLDRYNPLIDLTGEERIKATARRVGLNMPITVAVASPDQ